MRLRTKFILLFVLQSVIAAAVSVVFAYRAMGVEYDRAESEFKAPAAKLKAAYDLSLTERERLQSALKALDALRASEAASQVLRDQAMVETAGRIGVFTAAETVLAALLFAFLSMPLTKRLAQLSSGAKKIATDRSFRFGTARDREFSRVFESFDRMLDTISEQEGRLGEAARLEGWKEVSSFLFHQIRSPLAGMEMAAHNVELAAGKAATGALQEGEALSLCSASSISALKESERIRTLLDRFRDLSGLSMGNPERVSVRDVFDSARARFAPGKAVFSFKGEDALVSGDRRMLEEAMTNIAQNSVEACKKEPATVNLGVRLSGGTAMLEFSDTNGKTLPGLVEKAGTERFSTKKHGTGLGLLFVRRVAALHSGTFEAYAADDGFGVRLTLPTFTETQ